MKVHATVAISLLLLASSGRAAITRFSWQDGNGLWSTKSAWTPTPSTFPNSPDHAAKIDIVAGDSVVTLDKSITLNELEITSGDTLKTSAGAGLSFSASSAPALGPHMTNNGLFQPDAAQNFQIYFNSTTIFDGSGTLKLGRAGHTLVGDSFGFYNQTNHTIEGFGGIHTFGGGHRNTGMIRAKDGTLYLSGRMYNFDGAAVGGVLEAGAGGNLLLGNLNAGRSLEVYGGTIRSNGGTVTLDTVDLFNVTLQGSQLQAVNSFDWRGNNALASGAVLTVTNNPTLSTSVAIDPVVYGNPPAPVLTNDGTISLTQSGTSFTTLTASANSKITGSGRIVMGGGTKVVFAASSSGALVHDVNHTIEGGGILGGPIVNNGTLVANNGTLEIRGPITGTGAVRAENGGRLNLVRVGGDPVTGAGNLTTGSLFLGENGGIAVGFNMFVDVLGDFTIALLKENATTSMWNWDSTSTLYMSGLDDLNFLEVAGNVDRRGQVGNFDLPNLVIRGNIALTDAIDNHNRASPESLFVRSLQIASGGSLNLNGLSLFTLVGGNLHQVTELDDDLFGGAIVNQPVPLPPALLLLGSGLLGLVGVGGAQRHRLRN